MVPVCGSSDPLLSVRERRGHGAVSALAKMDKAT